jgi:Cu(I)/Ag(I) efflux system periplasmic protein CusF
MKAAVFAIVVTLATPTAIAQSDMKDMDMKDNKGMEMDHKGMDMKGMKGGKKSEGQVHKATGKVTKVDSSNDTVTINHEPVPSMKWPSMTMAFKVKDKAMLDKVKPGAKVDFSFTQSGKDYVITEIK